MSESRIVGIQEFYGGQSTDVAIGPKASFQYARALDHRTVPSQLSVLPGPREIANGAVNDLILNIIQVLNGNRYAYGEEGYIYKIDTSNAVTYAAKLPTGSDGALFRSDIDACYFATNTDVRRFYPMSGTPAIDAVYGPSKSIDNDAYRTGGAATCAIHTSLQEAHACYFSSDIEPFYSIKVNVANKGTGDWTLYLHDGLNNEIASVTIAAADMKTGWNEFVFTSQIRALVKPNARTYHFHLVSTVSGGTVHSETTNVMDTIDFELWAHRLVDTVNGLHPMIQFQQFNCIGNGNYLAVWEPLTDNSPPNNEFLRHRLVFPAGFEVCGLAVADGFLHIACEKRSSDDTKDFQEGMLFRWDGTSQTYEKFISISGGSPDSLFEYDNLPYFYVNGSLCCWPGGNNIVKVRKIANTATTYRDTVDNTRAYPNMMTIRDNLLLPGYPSTTTNTSIEHGVNSWGSLEKNYPASWGNLDYVISTGTITNTGGDLRIGCVRNFGDELYITWNDNGAFGIDIVDSYCDPAPIAKFRALRFDAGGMFKKKLGVGLGLYTKNLPEGATLTPVAITDENTEQQHTPMVEGENYSIVSIKPGNERFRRLSYGFDIACDGTVPAIIYCVALEWNSLSEQKARN